MRESLIASLRSLCAALSTRSARGFAGCVLLVSIVLHRPLIEMVRYSVEDSLYSHVALIPWICLYLVCTRPPTQEPDRVVRPAWGPALGLALCGGLLLLAPSPEAAAPADRLFRPMLTWVAWIHAAGFACLGAATMRRHAFAALFLVFVVPLPTPATEAVTRFLQVASAEASYGILTATGTPVFREGMVFHLPRLSVEVAAECSGIRSTYVLLLTSLIAGHLFLRSPWRQALFAASVLPIAILRNAVRIVTLSLATIHINPSLIDGPLHHRGGPAFFLLSLIPLFLVLLALRWTQPAGAGTSHRKGNAP